MSLDGSSEACPVTWLNSSGWKVNCNLLIRFVHVSSSSFPLPPYSFDFSLFLLLFYSPPPPPLLYLLPLPNCPSYSVSQLSPLFSIPLHTLFPSSRICYSYRNSTMTSLLYLRISRRIRQFGRIGKFRYFLFFLMLETMLLYVCFCVSMCSCVWIVH